MHLTGHSINKSTVGTEPEPASRSHEIEEAVSQAINANSVDLSMRQEDGIATSLDLYNQRMAIDRSDNANLK